jgi:hypothetical protein
MSIADDESVSASNIIVVYFKGGKSGQKNIKIARVKRIYATDIVLVGNRFKLA